MSSTHQPKALSLSIWEGGIENDLLLSFFIHLGYLFTYLQDNRTPIMKAFPETKDAGSRIVLHSRDVNPDLCPLYKLCFLDPPTMVMSYPLSSQGNPA